MIGASWGPDDTILIGGIFGGILRVPASGGNLKVVVKPQSSLSYHYPQFLPDGKSFFYDSWYTGQRLRGIKLLMQSIDKGDETIIA